MKLFLALLINVCLCSFIGAQNPVFTAEIRPPVVAVGESFEVTFTLLNAKGKNFRPPVFGPFEVLGGPNQALSTQIINGSFSQSLSYSYILRSSKPGKYVIGAAQIYANGKLISSNNLNIEIRNQSASSISRTNPKISTQDSNKDFFLKVVPSKQKAYVGEQVLVDYILYTRKSIQDHNFITDPNCTNAYTQVIRSDGNDTRDVQVNGRMYRSRLIRRLAIFPQESGEVIVEPAELEVEFVEDVTGFPFPSMIRPQDVVVKRYSTQQVKIQAIALPTPQPEDFIGASGNFSLNFGVSEKEITTDDAVSVILTVEGDGDIKRIQSPKLNFPKDFEVYDPKIKEETTEEMNGKLYSKKTLEYLLMPKKKGKYLLNPSASYFDPSSGRYISKALGSIEITVNQGSAKVSSHKEKEPEETSDKLVLSLKKVLVGLSALVIFGALIILLLLRYNKKSKQKSSASKINTSYAEENKPEPVIQIDNRPQIEKHLENGDYRSFYAAVNKDLKHWLKDKLSLETNNPESYVIIQTLKSKDYSNRTVQLAKHIFETCEMVLYAGLDKSLLMPQIMEEVNEFKQSIVSES